MTAVEDAAPVARSTRTHGVLALAASVTIIGTFLAGFLVGASREPSDRLRVDREVSGTVVKVGAGGGAVVIETDRGNESFQLLGDVPRPGEEVEGVVVELTTDGVSVEAVVLR